MSRIQRFRPTGAAVITGAVIGAMALAGCGAGQITQTSTQVPAVTGSNAGNELMVVRDAQIEFADAAKGAAIYPRGGTAPLKMSVVNTGGQPDRLVSASSPAAASVTISGEAAIAPGRVLLIEGAPAAVSASSAPASSAPAPPSGSARPTPANEVPTSPDPQAGDAIGGSGLESATATPAPPSTAPLPDNALPGQRAGQVVLTGLKDDVRAGLTYPLVLNFERAGQITVTVPVGYPSEPREDEPAE